MNPPHQKATATATATATANVPSTVPEQKEVDKLPVVNKQPMCVYPTPKNLQELKKRARHSNLQRQKEPPAEQQLSLLGRQQQQQQQHQHQLRDDDSSRRSAASLLASVAAVSGTCKPPRKKKLRSFKTRGGLLFPIKLRQMLVQMEEDGTTDIVSWIDTGTSDGWLFKWHDKDIFVTEILPRFFQQSKLKSFQRQLNLWGFLRVNSKKSLHTYGAYYHPQKLFLRERPDLVYNITRQETFKVKKDKNDSHQQLPLQPHPQQRISPSPAAVVVPVAVVPSGPSLRRPLPLPPLHQVTTNFPLGLPLRRSQQAVPVTVLAPLQPRRGQGQGRQSPPLKTQQRSLLPAATLPPAAHTTMSREAIVAARHLMFMKVEDATTGKARTTSITAKTKPPGHKEPTILIDTAGYVNPTMPTTNTQTSAITSIVKTPSPLFTATTIASEAAVGVVHYHHHHFHHQQDPIYNQFLQQQQQQQQLSSPRSGFGRKYRNEEAFQEENA